MLLVEIGHSYKCFEWSPIPDSEKLGRILLWTISYSNINCLLVCPRWSTCRLLDKFLSPQFGSSFFHLFQSSLLSEAPPQLIRKTLCYHEIPVKTREGEANDATSKTWYSTYIRESGSLKQGYGIVLISHKRYVHQIYVAVSNWVYGPVSNSISCFSTAVSPIKWFLPHSVSILDSQLSWESGKFQLARWSHEVALLPRCDDPATQPPTA